MFKKTLAIVLPSLLASVCMVTAGQASEDKTYVSDSSGNPVMSSDGCVVAGANGGKSFPKCGGMGNMVTPEPPMVAPPAMPKPIPPMVAPHQRAY